MKSKLNRICVVVERNNVIEKIVHDYFRDLKGKVKVDSDYLERQIVSWSYFDVGNENEEIFFKVYIQRYMSQSENINQLKDFQSNDVSALIVVRVDDEDKRNFKSHIKLSFYEDFNDFNSAIFEVTYLPLFIVT